MNGDVWRVVFAFLIDGEHERRPLAERVEAAAWVLYAD